MKYINKYFVVLVLLTILLTACSGAAAPAVAEEEPAAEEPAEEEEMVAEPEEEAIPLHQAGDSFITNSPVEGQRLVIMNADLVMIVEDPAEVLEYVTEMAVGYGGYVVSSELGQIKGQYGKAVPHATVTIRVPSGKLGNGLAEIEEQAVEVVSKNQSGKDVTKEYTDLQSRLRNLQRAEEQLNEVMENATTTQDVLRVYNELKKVTEQIEVLQGQIKYYEESATFSAITIELRCKEEAPPEKPEKKWQPGEEVELAIKDLKESMQRWTDGMTRFVIFTLPMLIIRLGPWVVAGWLIYRFVIRKRVWNKKKDKLNKTEEEKR